MCFHSLASQINVHIATLTFDRPILRCTLISNIKHGGLPHLQRDFVSHYYAFKVRRNDNHSLFIV